MSDNICNITLNDLPRYSPWPARLLGLEEWSVKLKTAQAVTREYEVDKWGTLFAKLEKELHPTLETADYLDFGYISEIPFYHKGRFHLAPASIVNEKRIDLYAGVLGRYLNNAQAIVELGAGYGSVILNLAKRNGFSGLEVIAAEYTINGARLIKMLAASEGLEVKVGHCDFRKSVIKDVDIPANSVIFTSFATPYVPELETSFVEHLVRLRPRVVVHFEPCYEHQDGDNLFALMCRRYIEVNDYNRNLVTVLKQAASRNVTEIIRVEKNVFGDNPFLPLSVIEWRPANG